jgi:hypothetical protein
MLIFGVTKIATGTTGEFTAPVESKPVSGVLNNTEILLTKIGSGNGLMVVTNKTDNKTAVFRIQGTEVISQISGDPLFSRTKDNAGTYNVYYDAGEFKVQNNVGDNKQIEVGFFITS